MGKMTRRTFLGASTATAVAIGLGQGCTPQSSNSASSGSTNSGTNSGTKVLNLYSARHYDTDDALYQGFTEATGVQVRLIEAEADELIERIKSEGTNSPADVLLTVDAGRLWRAEQEGLFQPVSSRVLETSIPDSLRHPQGLWFGLAKRARTIMYDRSKVNPEQLSTYEALADAQWKGQVLVRSSSNIYNQSLVGSLLEALGEPKTEAWARGFVANFARKPEGNDTAQIKACAAGAGSIAIANTYYLVRLAKSQDAAERAIAEKIGVFFPNQDDRGTHVNISGAGVAKNAPNREAAVQFLEYLTSPKAQALFAQASHEYPVLEGVELDPVLAGFGNFKSDSMNAAIFGRNNASALKLMDRVGWS